jgi:hypothetical protein
MNNQITNYKNFAKRMPLVCISPNNPVDDCPQSGTQEAFFLRGDYVFSGENL